MSDELIILLVSLGTIAFALFMGYRGGFKWTN